MDAALLEAIAERVHIGWMQERQSQGAADHPRMIDGDGRGCCLAMTHHPDMLPYADLAENVKEYDRATVRAVFAGIEAAGYVVVPAATSTPHTREAPRR